MMSASVQNFDQWRGTARSFLSSATPPDQIDWSTVSTGQNNLFAPTTCATSQSKDLSKVPASFLPFAAKIACHRDDNRWHLLYQALWRLTNGEPHLFKLVTDPLIHRLNRMAGEISRDAHKTKAFVRFRLLQEDGDDHYIAWHRPDHRIISLVAPFFQRRFQIMRWSIFTPDESVFWNGERLHYGTGVAADKITHQDAFEDLWRTYYRATFNPARVNVEMMKREMPVRHWPTLPEARLIPDLLAAARNRVDTMIDTQEGLVESAENYLPPTIDYPSLKTAAAQCRACPLYCNATQTVFGEGPPDARIMIVAEQPGDQEDIAGRPLVGPTGQLFNELLGEIGVARDTLYLTNAVKHFKFEPRGKQRLHRPPDSREINACKPWLLTEIELVRPAVIVTLGATAGRSLVHHGFTLKQHLDQPLTYKHYPLLPTWHPAAVLRAMEMDKQKTIRDHIRQTLLRATQVS